MCSMVKTIQIFFTVFIHKVSALQNLCNKSFKFNTIFYLTLPTRPVVFRKNRMDMPILAAIYY